MRKFAEKIQRFMAGRNGSDSLNIFLMALYFIIFIVNLFFKSQIISIIDIVLILYWIFRFYSRHVGKRQTENSMFLRTVYKLKQIFRLILSKFKRKNKRVKPIKTVKRKKQKIKHPKTDKSHTYVTCPICDSQIKVRKIKGERYVLCPICHNEVKIKI